MATLAGENAAHIIVTLDAERPIEIGDFVSAFTAVAGQYEKFIRENRPDLTSEAQIFVKEVRPGSIVADLIPFTPHALLDAGAVISAMDQILIVEQFVRLYGARLGAFFSTTVNATETSKSDLKDFMDAVSAIAKDPNGSAKIEAAYFEGGKPKIKAAVKFDTKEARRAIEHIEARRRVLERTEHADHERVLMVFRQSNVKDRAIGRRTGEWVRIEDISDRELPLIYASDLAEQRIKHEIREAPENVFKKGFVVDVNVETKGGRPVAFASPTFIR